MTPGEFSAGQAQLASALSANIQANIDGVPAKLEGMACVLDSGNNIELHFSVAAQPFKHLEMTFSMIKLLAPGHRMFFSLLGSDGRSQVDRLLTQKSPAVSLDIEPLSADEPPAPAAQLPTFLGFIKMGFTHIGTGYDHLLFLFALLLVARNFKSALLIITSFTVAHSLTLAVATFDLISISPTIT